MTLNDLISVLNINQYIFNLNLIDICARKIKESKDE